MSQNDKDRINQKLEKSLKNISEETLELIAKEDGALNNVLKGLNTECLGLCGERAFFSSHLILFYVLARNEKIFTEALELELRDNDVNYLTLAFCRHLAQNYEHLDLLDVFNEFQHKVKTYIEMFNYRTVDTNLFEEVKGLDFLLMIPNEDGIFYVPTLGKLKFYRDFFGDTYKKEKHPDIEAVYLLLDLDSSNIKIGQSRKMIHRERTLQAQKPSIELIAYWISPKQVETQLHQMFKSKRLRGEWFKLSFADLKTIKKFMESISVPTGLSVPAGFSPDTPTT